MNIITEVYIPSHHMKEPLSLTEENLSRHSDSYPAVTGKTDLMEMFHSSLQQENKRRLRKSRRFPTPVPSPTDQISLTTSSSASSSDPSSRRSRRVSSSDVAIGAKTMPFPYHNDTIFLPTAESPPPPHFDTVSIRASIPPSLKQSSHKRPSSPPIWWRKNESNSSPNVLRFSYKSNEIPRKNIIPEKSKRKALPKKVSHWCQKTWLRITRQ